MRLDWSLFSALEEARLTGDPYQPYIEEDGDFRILDTRDMRSMKTPPTWTYRKIAEVCERSNGWLKEFDKC